MVADVVSRTDDLDSPESVVAAIAATKLDTMVGPVDWSSGPVKNVSKTPLVSGQWQAENGKYDLKIVANSAAPQIPLTGDLKML